MTNEHDDRVFVRNLRRGGGLFALLLTAFAAAYSWQSWRGEKVEHIERLSAFAELGEKALDAHFSQLERALDLLSRDLIGEDGRPDARHVRSLLQRFIQVHTDLLNIALVRLDGQILVAAHAPPDTALASVANEPSFLQSREELLAGRTLSIARPLIGLMVRQWVIPLRYGIRDKQGNLQFIVTAGMPLARPQSFWESAPLPAGAAAGVRRDDDYLVSRYPTPVGVELEEIYGRPVTGALSQRLRGERYPASGVVEGTGSLAGPDRLFVFRRLAHYPLTFFVVMPLSYIRAEWWREIQFTYLLMLVLMAGGIAVYVRTLRRQRAWETERQRSEKQAREALEARERQLDSILDAVPAQVAHFDAEQRYRFVNLAFEKWNGVSRAHILGKTLREVRGEEAYRQRQSFVEIALSGRCQTSEDYFDFPVIGRRYVLASWVPDVAPDGTVQGLYTITTDLTERKQAHERELATEKALRNTLVQEVHHRVKNALQGTVLLMDAHTRAHPELAAAMEPAVARLNAMAAVFGLQAADASQPLPLGQLVAAICGLLAKAMAVSIEPHIESAAAAALQLAEDETVPVALIINELVFNAVKHGRPGEPVRVFLEGGGAAATVRVLNAAAAVRVLNAAAPLPRGFDFASGAGLGTGLRLVKSLLMRESVRLDLRSGPDGVAATLVLLPPAIAPGGAGAA